MMIRHSIFAGLLAALTLTACDKAADEQQKANKAQTEADEKISTVQKDADEKANGAQANADKKIAEAQASFMKMREDYRHKMSDKLTDLDHRVADLDAKVKTQTGKAKADLDANLKVIHERREAFVKDQASLDNAAAATWDDVKVRLDKEWDDLKALVDKA